eukprot:gene2104-3054_t
MPYTSPTIKITHAVNLPCRPANISPANISPSPGFSSPSGGSAHSESGDNTLRYPVPIKAPSVRALDVHPIVFQMYKSLCVFLTCWLGAAVVYMNGGSLWLSGWGIASAAAWIPSGLCTIYSVPRIGLGLAVVLTSTVAVTASFAVSIWVLQEYTSEIYTSVLLMLGLVAGMASLVASGHVPLYCGDSAYAELQDPHSCSQGISAVVMDVQMDEVTSEHNQHSPVGIKSRRVSCIQNPQDQHLGPRDCHPDVEIDVGPNLCD